MLGTSQQQPASPHDMKKRGLTVTPPRASRHLTVATGSSGTSVDVIDDDCVSSGWADGVSSGWAECINNGRDECINNGRASPSISSPIVHDHDSDAKLLSPPPEVQSNQRHGQRRGDEETSTGKLGERIATVRRTRSATTSSVVALLVGGGSSTASGSSDGRSTTAAAHSSSTASLDLATSSATLLPRPVAAAISSVAFYSRLSLRVAGSLTRYSVEAVKAGTRLSLGLSRDVMVASLFAAGTLLAPRSSRIAIMGRVEETPKAILGMDDEVDETCNSGDAVILQADTMKADPSGNEDPVTLTPRANDKKASLSVDAHSPPVSSPMTSTALSMTPRAADPRDMNVLAALGICAVHQFFTAAERVTEACLDVTQTVASVSFATAEEMVRAVDGIFGSTDTSQSVAEFAMMLRRHLALMRTDDEFARLSFMQTVKAIVAFLFIQSRTRDRYVSTLRMRQLFAVVAPPDSSYVLSVDHPMNVEEKLRALLGQERVAGGDSRSPAASSPTSTAVDAISTDTAAIDNTECPITDAYTEPIRWQGEAQHFPLKAYHQSPEQLLRNLQRYIRFATASYGHRFMQVLGVANYDVPTGSGPYIDADGRTHPFDHVIFSRHVGLPLEAVLDSTANTEPHLTSRASLHLRPLVLHVPNYYLAVDHASKTIIVTIRGTLGLSDMLTNLSCEYTSIWVNGAACQVHAGMFAQARALARPHGRLHNVVKKALLQWADHGLVICGHSMGGGVASLLGLLWSSLKVEDDDNGTMDAAPGSPSGSAYPVGTFLTSRSSKLPANRPVHVYSYGTPCVASLSLSTSLKGLVTSVIHGRDFTYSLCLGIFHDMRQAIVNLSDPHAPVSDQVLKKAMGLTVATSKPTANADTNESLHMTPTRAFSPSFGFPDVVASERDEGTNDDQDYVVVVDADHLSAMGKSDDDDLGSALSTDNDAPIDAKSSIPEYSTDDDWFWSLRTSLQADMQHDKLYAPGDIYWLRAESEGASSVESAVPPLSLLARSHKVAMVLVDVEELFPAVLLSRSALLDHLPTRYEWCLDTLAAEHLDRGDKSASNLSSVINQ